jgi:hypothetical protein
VFPWEGAGPNATALDFEAVCGGGKGGGSGGGGEGEIGAASLVEKLRLKSKVTVRGKNEGSGAGAGAPTARRLPGLRYRPRKGDALLFLSLGPDGSFVDQALHGGCPVVKGQKYVLTHWVRDKPIPPGQPRPDA